MPRLIFTSRYLNAASKSKSANLVNYIATRKGVDNDLFAEKENFVEYMAKRPGAHGLFNGDDVQIDLKAVQDEVANHPGRVWTHVVSLRREDAERLGYNTAQAWKSTVIVQLPIIAENMKIPTEYLRWYAAFHNESHHPHIHMLVYSANPKWGFLTEQGIENMRSAFANEIFKQDLIQIFQEKTMRGDKLKAIAEERMREIKDMPHTDNPALLCKIDELAKFLETYKGKAMYRFLPQDGKVLVDDIFRELSRDTKITEMYKSWCDMKDAVLSTYKDGLSEHGELTAQKEFYSIRNMIIREAQRVREHTEPIRETIDEIEDEYNIPQSHYEYYNGTPSPSIGAVAKLLYHLSRIIQNQYENNHRKVQDHTERKLMQKIAQKKEAIGQKWGY